MAEKAVDENPAVGGMSVFNAVTRKIHSSPTIKFALGSGVNTSRGTI